MSWLSHVIFFFLSSLLIVFGFCLVQIQLVLNRPLKMTSKCSLACAEKVFYSTGGGLLLFLSPYNIMSAIKILRGRCHAHCTFTVNLLLLVHFQQIRLRPNFRKFVKICIEILYCWETFELLHQIKNRPRGIYPAIISLLEPILVFR